jgi:hypothetical protein
MNPLPGLQVDHINGNTLDNRKFNLRICTAAENTKNTKLKSSNTSGYKGVAWHTGTNKWRAYIVLDNRQKHLGLFKTKEEAALSYNEAALKYHKSFARLNNII